MKQKGELERLQSEANQIIQSLGMDGITETDKQKAHARLSELTEEMVIVSKRGDAPTYVINLLPARYIPNGGWRVSRSYSSFFIPGRENDKPYSVTEITGHVARLDTGRGGEAHAGGGWRTKLDKVAYQAKQVAEDIVQEINGDLPPMVSGARVGKTLGVFLSPTRVPTPELIEAELAKLNVYLSALVSDGNMIWRKTRDYRQVSDLSRMAADLLSVSTEWHETVASFEACPGCGSSIKKGVAKCMSCGAILDREKAIELGIFVPAPEHTARAAKR